MATASPFPEPQASPPGFAARILGMCNIFIDPRSAVQVIPYRLSWLWPLLVSGIVTGVTGFLSVPTVLRVMQSNPPGNLTAAQLARALPMIELTQKISAVLSPVLIGVLIAIFAGMLSAACAVLDIRSTFRDNFAVLAQCSLIGMVHKVAGFFVVRLKGDEIQSLQELQPAFGLDLIFYEGVNKTLLAVMNYFSVFTIWYIVMLGLAFSAMTGVSKRKSFGATAPVWVVAMLFAVIAALLGRG